MAWRRERSQCRWGERDGGDGLDKAHRERALVWLAVVVACAEEERKVKIDGRVEGRRGVHVAGGRGGCESERVQHNAVWGEDNMSMARCRPREEMMWCCSANKEKVDEGAVAGEREGAAVQLAQGGDEGCWVLERGRKKKRGDDMGNLD